MAQHFFSLPFLMPHLDLAQSLTSPNEQHGCLIQAIDGRAAGCALTHNSDPKIYNVPSILPSTDPWWKDKWLVKKVDSKTYHKIKAIHFRDDEHTRNKSIITSSKFICAKICFGVTDNLFYSV